MKKKLFVFALIVLSIFALVSCKEETPNKAAEITIDDNNFICVHFAEAQKCNDYTAKYGDKEIESYSVPKNASLVLSELKNNPFKDFFSMFSLVSLDDTNKNFALALTSHGSIMNTMGAILDQIGQLFSLGEISIELGNKFDVDINVSDNVETVEKIDVTITLPEDASAISMVPGLFVNGKLNLNFKDWDNLVISPIYIDARVFGIIYDLFSNRYVGAPKDITFKVQYTDGSVVKENIEKVNGRELKYSATPSVTFDVLNNFNNGTGTTYYRSTKKTLSDLYNAYKECNKIELADANYYVAQKNKDNEKLVEYAGEIAGYAKAAAGYTAADEYFGYDGGTAITGARIAEYAQTIAKAANDVAVAAKIVADATDATEEAVVTAEKAVEKAAKDAKEAFTNLSAAVSRLGNVAKTTESYITAEETLKTKAPSIESEAKDSKDAVVDVLNEAKDYFNALVSETQTSEAKASVEAAITKASKSIKYVTDLVVEVAKASSELSIIIFKSNEYGYLENPVKFAGLASKGSTELEKFNNTEKYYVDGDYARAYVGNITFDDLDDDATYYYALADEKIYTYLESISGNDFNDYAVEFFKLVGIINAMQSEDGVGVIDMGAYGFDLVGKDAGCSFIVLAEKDGCVPGFGVYSLKTSELAYTTYSEI